MEMTGITVDQFRAAVSELNQTDEYAGNLRVHPDTHSVSSRRIRGRLDVRDSYRQGARLSWSGRHGRQACWHAFRDVLTELFTINPDAVIRTSMATYRGIAGFELTFPDTAWRNVGSMMRPAYMPDLCVEHGRDFPRVYIEHAPRPPFEVVGTLIYDATTDTLERVA